MHNSRRNLDSGVGFDLSRAWEIYLPDFRSRGLSLRSVSYFL